jgi:chemotaxis protein MotB
VIESYADNEAMLAPLKDRCPNNWYRSVSRIISVVSYLEEQGLDSNQLSAVAFGKHHSVSSNNSPQGRAQNRRINVVIED